MIAEWHMDDKCYIKWHKSLDYNASKKGPYIFSLLNITKYRLMFFLFHIWQWTKFVFGFNLYLCVRSIDFVSFYNISIGSVQTVWYWNCSDCVILELFRLCDIVSIGYWNCSDCAILFLLDIGTVQTVWYCFYWILELFRLCDIVSIGTVQTMWYCFYWILELFRLCDIVFVFHFISIIINDVYFHVHWELYLAWSRKWYPLNPECHKSITLYIVGLLNRFCKKHMFYFV